MSQIIDLGNSGIHFAESGVINLGSHGSGIQIIGPPGIAGKYMLKMSGIKDLVSRNSQTDTSAGAAYYIHPTTGELVTVAAGEVLNHPTLGNVSFDTYEQLCQDSEDPGEWDNGGLASIEHSGETSGPFIETVLSDTGALTNRAYIWRSSISGSPSGVLYFSIKYRAGTSNRIYVLYHDTTTGSGASYVGIIGTAGIANQGSDSTLSIISDAYDSTLGYYVLKGSVIFTNLSNALAIGIGSNSTDNSSILVLGADVSEDPTILDFHVPSSGSNVTIASRAGTTKLADIDTDFSKFRDSLGGEVDGVELLPGWDFTSGWEYSQVIGVEILDADSFITTVAAAGITYDVLDENTYYEITCLGNTTGTFGISILGTARTEIASDFGVYRFTTGADETKLYLRNTLAGTTNITTLSVKQISPAAARHSFTWTPGVDYTKHTTVASIMTPSTATGFLKASAAGGFELSDGTNTLRWPPTVGDDIPRSWVQTLGTGATITGDVIEFVSEAARVSDSDFWVIGKNYRVNVTVSEYSGTSYILLPYSSGKSALSISANGTSEYDYSPINTEIRIYSNTGHTATVTVNSIYELAPYQFEAGVSYPMEIVYGYNEALDAYKMELSVYIDGSWISVMGDFDQSFNPGTDFIYGLSNTYQSAVKGHTVERLQQSHWRLYPTWDTEMVDYWDTPIAGLFDRSMAV